LCLPGDVLAIKRSSGNERNQAQSSLEEVQVPMRASRFSEEQIGFALKQAEMGTPVLEVCRKMGVSEQTY
jgi:hypothetical protein